MKARAKQTRPLSIAAAFVCLLFVLQPLQVHGEEGMFAAENKDHAENSGRAETAVSKEQSNSAVQKPADRYGDVVADKGDAGDSEAIGSSQGYGDISPGEYEGTEAKGEEQQEAGLISDPIEPVNRFFFKFNDKLYFWLIKPVSRAYRTVIPEEFRTIFGNFYRNIGAPIRIVNNLLQLKAKQTGTEIFRFIVNSTIGVGGLRDVGRDAFGVEPADEDLGQTFGFYGFGTGFYIVLPVLGPSSARDGLGTAGDWYLSPITYVDPTLLSYGLKAHDRVNHVSFRIGDYEAFKKAALDPYVAMREAYAANRAAEIKK